MRYRSRAVVVGALLTLGWGCDRREPAPKPAPPAPSAIPSSTSGESSATPPRPDAGPLASPYAKPYPAPPPGPEVCADCHPDETDGFRETGMGRALYRPQGATVIEDFDPEAATVKHPLTGVTYRAYVDDEGRWWQEETFEGTEHRFRVEAKYIVGSGNHTRSYIGELEGELVELPLTWYSHRKIWDMSPGYETANHYGFERPIKPQCIFCHNDLSPSVDGTMSRYARFAEGITCTRCHGDGTAHVKKREAGEEPPPGQPDPDILNPARLDAVGQLRLCQQCHLTGKARVLMPGRRWDHYDPREPLHDYVSIYVPERDGGPSFGISSHGDRLALSACAKGSGGSLGCTRCHDPHKPSFAKARRDACLGCHQVEQCGDEHGRTGDDCASCHMYRGDTSDIPHVTFTDHFIRKRPRNDAELDEKPGVGLVDALASSRVRDDPGDRRERDAIAHAHVWRYNGDERYRPVARQKLLAAVAAGPKRVMTLTELGQLMLSDRNAPGAVAALEEAAKRSDDPLLRVDLASAYEKSGRLVEAERALREAVEKRPDYRIAWGNLANTLQRMGRYDEAETAYARAEALAPHLAVTANNRGHNSINRGRFDEAQRWFEEAVRRDGTDPMGRFNLGTLALRGGDKARARRHFHDALKLKADFGLSHWLLGRLDLEEGDLAGSRKHLRAFLQADPANPNAYLDLSRLEYRAGDAMASREVLMRGLMAAPGHPAIQAALNKVIAGHPP